MKPNPMKHLEVMPTIHLDRQRLALLVSVCIAACQEALAATAAAPQWSKGSPGGGTQRGQNLLEQSQGTEQKLGSVQAPEHTPDAKLLLTVEEAARRLSIGRPKMYELIMRGAVHSIKIGASRRIPAVALDEFITLLGRNEADV